MSHFATSLSPRALGRGYDRWGRGGGGGPALRYSADTPLIKSAEMPLNKCIICEVVPQRGTLQHAVGVVHEETRPGSPARD